MKNKSHLDSYWDEFINNFIKALLADGYEEFDILDKIMTNFKQIRLSNTVPTVCDEVTEIVEETTEVVPVVKKRKYPEHKKNPNRVVNPHNYDKTLCHKFLHAEVYVEGKKDESFATIEVGPNQKIRDVYKLVSTGERLSEVEYLKRFNTSDEDTPKGYKYLNRAKIKFNVNPKVNVMYVKSPKNYKNFQSIEDIKTFTMLR